MNLEESDALDRLAKMRPSPSYYIAHGTKNTIQDIYGRAKSRNLAKRDSRWTFVFHDWNAESFPKSQLSAQVTFMQMTGTYKYWRIIYINYRIYVIFARAVNNLHPFKIRVNIKGVVILRAG